MNIKDKSEKSCTGCGLCVINCPFGAINLVKDNGFFLPNIDYGKCVQCGKCKTYCARYICPPSDKEILSKNIFAVKARETIICRKSSSGGVAFLLCKHALEMGYTVCGVIYDSSAHITKHIVVSDINKLDKVQGTKYLQSYTVDILNYLKKNPDKKILIVGTPCQIRPIRLWANENHRTGLFLIDFFCQGVPSYNMWEKYLSYIVENNKLAKHPNVIFRDKSVYKWHDCQITINDKNTVYSSSGGDDLFFRLYNSSLCFNDACYECGWKVDHSYADIRLGDFWGERFRNDDDGVSIVICQTNKGMDFFDKVSSQLVKYDVEYSDFEKAVSGLTNKRSEKVDKMLNMINSEIEFERICKKTVNPSYIQRVKKKFSDIYHRIIQ